MIEKELKSYYEDNSLAIEYLQSLSTCTRRIGVADMYLGGHFAFRAALDTRIQASFCFFATDIHNHAIGKGKRDNSVARSTEIIGELLMVFVHKDIHRPLEGHDLIRSCLCKNLVQIAFIELNGAQYVFNID